MSKITNPETEISVSCGFFNSINDRKYSAKQMSSLFDGIINDGIFMSIGGQLVVHAGSGNTVNVNSGKAWFNSTWTENDAVLPVICDDSEVLQDRIDAIVVEVDQRDDVRDNFIKYVKGTTNTSPERPTMLNSTYVHQHALCYIYRKAGSTEITESDITNMVGTSETPFITSVLQTTSLDELLGQWQHQLDVFVANEAAELDRFVVEKETDLSEWYEGMKQTLNDILNELNTFKNNEKASILAWFDDLSATLSGNVAAKIKLQIDRETVERLLMTGLTDGTKTFSDDGRVITMTGSGNKSFVKTFSSDFLTCTSVLKDAEGGLLGEMVKTFSSDGNTVDTTINIYLP